MNLSPEENKEFLEFPNVLRELVSAELAAGNEIAEFGHGHPAAPCGAYILLKGPVRSRPREKTPELDFYDRNRSNYSGEFTDAKRHFFVLEPPHPPEPELDMDAIRAQMENKYLEANRYGRERNQTYEELQQEAKERARMHAMLNVPDSTYTLFKKSMNMDYDKWREGIGYDLDLIREATGDDLRKIEEMLLQRRELDWRDVEALAVLGSEPCKQALKTALTTESHRVKMAILTYAPTLVPESRRIAVLVQALEQANLFEGLSQALDMVAEFHPPEIVDTLMRGLMERDGGVACQFAGMLYYIHGKSSSPFDWDHRPFFLRFNTDNLDEREKVVRELFAELGVDARRYIKPKRF